MNVGVFAGVFDGETEPCDCDFEDGGFVDPDELVKECAGVEVAVDVRVGVLVIVLVGMEAVFTKTLQPDK